MRILVTGSDGQLGSDLVPVLLSKGYSPICPSRSEMNIADEENVSSFIRECSPDAIIHLAAWTDVDGAEEHSSECFRVNAEGTGFIASEAKKLSVPMMYISSDYVFDGSGEAPRKTTEAPNPEKIPNRYGYSKYMGEVFTLDSGKFFIVRTSWVFGKNGRNFIKTILNLCEKTNAINVVSDQIGSPTYTKDLSILLADMIESDRYGIYHATNEGFCSWYDLADFTIRHEKITGTVINPIPTSEYITRARRPLNSRLDKSDLDKNGFKRLPSWQDAVERYLEEIRD